MTRERWQRIEELFSLAIEQPLEERARFLEAHCSDDADLRREVEKLLQADHEAGGFLTGAVPIPGPEASGPAPSVGDTLGSYRIVGVLGEGGMGTVFLAERADGAFSLRVAIKVLRRGTESQEAVERLERERRILAALDHPGIARLLDGGTTTTGLPFVVMEHIDGEPIDQACARGELPVAQKIDWMIEVCDAVTAAHRSLVVHRDLKPSNILIDREGRPRLLDFGIAKWLEPEMAPHGEAATATWNRRLTPTHASPEQLRGEPVTVATDVYLLGVVLYQVLTGELPHRFEGASLAELERAVTERSPDPPSTHVRGLDGDLDAIVLRALRAEPEHRYGSVEALSADLLRWREGLPVRARRGNRLYVAGKLMRRHGLALTTALLFVAMVTAFAISSTLQARELERTVERLLAVEGFVSDLFAASSPEASQGREVLLSEALERGKRRLQHAGPTEAGARGLLQALFGRMALHLGDLSTAREDLERALETYASLPADPLITGAVSRARSELALTKLYLGEDFERVEALAQSALGQATALEESDPDLVHDLLNHLVTVYCWHGQWEKAAPVVAEAASLARQEPGSRSLRTAKTWSLQALLLKNHEDHPAEARRMYERSLALYRQLEGDTHPDVAVILNQLGLLARDSGDLAASEGFFVEALELRRQVLPAGHWEIAQSLYQVAAVRRRAGHLDEAEPLLREALAIYAADPELGPEYGWAVFCRLHLVEILSELGRLEEAAALLDDLSAEWWQSRKPGSRLLALARRAEGCLLVERGRLEAARPLLLSSLEVLTDAYGVESWEADLAKRCLQRAEVPGTS